MVRLVAGADELFADYSKSVRRDIYVWGDWGEMTNGSRTGIRIPDT